jgi:dihydrofolate reductase
MMQLTFDITMSLDGFIAGPNMDPEHGLGQGGDRLHQWAYGTRAFSESPGRSGVMGRNMFGGGQGPWGEDKAWGDWEGWWGDEPPFRMPVFVLTHHPREPLVKGDTTFTFVTDGIESALEQAQAAAGDKSVALGGGADVAQQYLRAALLDELQVHVAPVLLGEGVRLFDNLGADHTELEITRVIESPAVTHVRYRVVK